MASIETLEEGALSLRRGDVIVNEVHVMSYLIIPSAPRQRLVI